MLRLDEIGENCENLKAKVVSYTTNKTEQSRGGQKDMYVPMGVGHVRGSEPQKEDWENVDEVRRGSMCSNYGMMRHVARDCRRNGMGKVKGGEGGKEYAQGRGNTTKDMEKERRSQIWRTQGRMFRRTERLRIPRTVLDVRQGRTQVIRMSMESRLRQ